MLLLNLPTKEFLSNTEIYITINLNSLKQYKYENHCDLAIKISVNNFGYDKDNKILTLPIYMAFLLANDIAEGKDLIKWLEG